MALEHFRKVKEQGDWRSYATSLLSEVKLTPDEVVQFHTYWIEAGHHVREQIGNDRTLVRLLRHLLPAYEGKAIELFRGENRSRWENRAIGLAWTPNVKVAKMFGRGLNAINSGGVLLKAQFNLETIISGPNSHSQYLGESQFTIDPFLLSTAEAIEFFPQVT